MRIRILRLIPVIFVIIGLSGTSYYFYSRFKGAQYLLNNPDAASKIESDAVISKVSKLIVLPSGETPQIATIIDADKLKGEPFFVNAKNNDKVLVYSKAGEAIIFRPDSNLIVQVGPIYTGSTPNPSATPSSQSVKVSLYNGTNTAGLTNTAESSLTSKFPDIQIASKSDAVNKNYQTSLVIDLTGKNKDISQIIAKDINATATSLPAGETPPPDTDILIILGSNWGK